MNLPDELKRLNAEIAAGCQGSDSVDDLESDAVDAIYDVLFDTLPDVGAVDVILDDLDPATMPAEQIITVLVATLHFTALKRREDFVERSIPTLEKEAESLEDVLRGLRTAKEPEDYMRSFNAMMGLPNPPEVP